MLVSLNKNKKNTKKKLKTCKNGTKKKQKSRKSFYKKFNVFYRKDPKICTKILNKYQ